MLWHASFSTVEILSYLAYPSHQVPNLWQGVTIICLSSFLNYSLQIFVSILHFGFNFMHVLISYCIVNLKDSSHLLLRVISLSVQFCQFAISEFLAIVLPSFPYILFMVIPRRMQVMIRSWTSPQHNVLDVSRFQLRLGTVCTHC